MNGAAASRTPVGTMAPTPASRTPDHRSWTAALMVFVGGAIGTLTRESLDLVTPAEFLLHTTFAINITGSFALSVLYTALVVRKRTPPVQRRVRLLVGTGFMGGFTTYGSFSVGVAAAASRGSVGDAALYAIGSIVLGIAAAVAGRALVDAVNARRASSSKRAAATERASASEPGAAP